MITAEDLKAYGKVEKCEAFGDSFEIKITDGFKPSAMKTFDLMKIIHASVGKTYSVVGRLITDDNLFHYILNKSKK